MHSAPWDARAELRGTDLAFNLFMVQVSIGSARHCGAALRDTGSLKSDPFICALVAHLLQQIVDERASQHVEETASSYSIDV